MATHHHISVAKTGTVALVALALTALAMFYPKLSMQLGGAFVGGIFPALFWLWFWLQEDRVNPEPKKIIFEAFIFGMIAVVLAIFIEKLTLESVGELSLLLFVVWAVVEETLKYIAAYFAGIRTKYFDEPVDVVMYMISSSLGFAALENVLFIYNSAGVMNLSIIPLRFIGASLLHVVCSAFIGFGIGFGISKSKFMRVVYLLLGLITAFALHTSFNYFIIITEGKYLFNIFMLLWAVVALIIFLFEVIKRSPYYRTIQS